MTTQMLASLYREAHNRMRNIDGLLPQEAFDELLKYLLFRQFDETSIDPIHLGSTLNFKGGFSLGDSEAAAAIRTHFARYLKEFAGSANDIWSDASFRLSDAALLKVHELFEDIHFTTIGVDARSAALRMLLSPDLRRGLGIYLTPDEVVRVIVQVASPAPNQSVYDPACGSGTFLIETINFWRNNKINVDNLKVIGSDINARMLLLAELNLGHMDGVAFDGQVIDAIGVQFSKGNLVTPNSVDFIFTNPPFGVYVDPASVRNQEFSTIDNAGSARIQSEVLFIEQSLRLLKPGGMLGIVIPRSVVTNDSLSNARKALDRYARLVGVINLPSETFSMTGTQTMTSVLFMVKRQPGEREDGESLVMTADVSNVGFDSTGRAINGSQLPQIAEYLRASILSGQPTGLVRGISVPRSATLTSYGDQFIRRSVLKTSRRLEDIVELAQTGRTPPRARYTQHGIFTLKVGNLTGQGIDWTARERNFVDPNWASKGLLLSEGDIVMTSSAHHPRYIAQKVDIIRSIPEFLSGKATFVGEVLRLRVKPGCVDPYELLAYLRMPTTRSCIQEMIRGQTAHLRPKDLLELPIPDQLASAELVDLLRREAELARELNLVMAEQRTLMGVGSLAIED